MRWWMVALAVAATFGCERGSVGAPEPPLIDNRPAIELTVPVTMSLPAPARADGTAATVVQVETAANTSLLRIGSDGDAPTMGALHMTIRYFPTQIEDRRSVALLREAASVPHSVDAMLTEHAAALSFEQLPRMRIVTLDTRKLGTRPGNTYIIITKQKSPFGALLLAPAGFLSFDWNQLEVDWPIM